jgi:hypothetical protein
MVSIKQQIQRILDNLPDDCSIEDVQYHLYVAEKIRNRMDSVGKGEFVPQSDAERRLAKWIIP